MADLLVRHLKMKAESHSALRSLYSQWDFDEKLIPKALQTVGSLFPHYSRHDESHSKQILVNIERLLGNNINLLTATDTWMLLESAYWHDIGMVVPHNDLQAALDDPQFQEFIDTIRNQPNHELHSFACLLRREADPTLIFQSSAPLETLTKFREMMAEWFRRQHPGRAEQILRSPISTVGINSPRTELIPARLFRLLGRICQMHGATFEALMSENGLPFREAGLAQDDCHPRFVACLLRMGDLLDLDDNRFCPVMQRIAGDQRSKLSKAHEDKHAGMRHLRIDQEKIEVSAECETVDGYLEAFRWFDWLKQEVQNQMMHWRDIAPSRELGLLPMLGPVSVRLSGNLQILKDGERPAFTVDTHKAIELLQGNNLYESKFACVRELLQNAVDATLLRIWLTNKKHASSNIWATPDNLDVKGLFARAPISVDLAESEPTKDGTKDKSVWTLTIQDDGTGISRSDLEHMLRIGGSQSNTDRQREINQMPEWMKPSGAFGIGLQSVFMLCNEVSLRTKSIFSNEILDVTMYSPTGPQKGLVVLRRLNDDISISHGTKVTLKFELDSFAKSWSVSNHEKESIAYRLITGLDPVLDERFPYEAALLADQVRTFGQYSLIPVQGKLTTISHRFEIDSENFDSEGGQGNEWRFIKAGQSEVKLFYKPSIGVHPALSLLTLYRGQKFETKHLFFPNVIIGIDLMSGNAGSWLNFNRDKISSQAHEFLEKTVLASLDHAVDDDLRNADHCSLLNGENRAVYSLFLKGMALSFGGRWSELANILNDAWLDIVVTKQGEGLRNFFERREWIIATKQSSHERELPDCDLLIDSSPADLTLRIILTEWAKLPGRTIQALGPQRVYDHSSIFVGPETMAAKHQRMLDERALLRNRYRLRNEPQEPYDRSALAIALWEARSTAYGNRRYLLQINDAFEHLTLRPEIKLAARHLIPNVPGSKKYMLLPFLFLGAARSDGIQIETTSGQIDALSRWTQSRLRETAPLEDVRRWYGELAHFIDYEIMKPTVFWDRWKRARGLSH